MANCPRDELTFGAECAVPVAVLMAFGLELEGDSQNVQQRRRPTHPHGGEVAYVGFAWEQDGQFPTPFSTPPNIPREGFTGFLRGSNSI